MKKLMIVLLSVTILAVAVATTAFANDDDLIAERGTLTLDGVMDEEAYTKATEIKIETVTKGSPEATATARCAWDGQNMYVFFTVIDSDVSDTLPANLSELYRVDSVEFYIFLSDFQGNFLINDVNAAQWTAPAPISGAESFSGGGMHKTENESGADFASVKTADGYNVEMKIPFGSKFTAEANKFINVAFSVNDENATDGEHQISSWSGLKQAYANTSGYKLMRLNQEGVEYVPAETTEVTFETRPEREPTPLELPNKETGDKTTTKNDTKAQSSGTEASSGGCGSVIAGGTVASVAVAAVAIALKKKKDNDE